MSIRFRVCRYEIYEHDAYLAAGVSSDGVGSFLLKNFATAEVTSANGLLSIVQTAPRTLLPLYTDSI